MKIWGHRTYTVNIQLSESEAKRILNDLTALERDGMLSNVMVEMRETLEILMRKERPSLS